MRKQDLRPPLVALVAFALRAVRLQSRPLWYDEAFAILYGDLPPGRMIYGTVTGTDVAGAADVHPLLYYFSLHGWMKMVGRSPLAARFLSVAFGMITMALLWRFASWCFNRRAGLAVALLVAVNPFHVAYSQETRMYALLGLTTVTAAWGLLRALEVDNTGSRSSARRVPCSKSRSPLMSLTKRWKWWGLYTLGTVLTLYAHNLGGVFVLAFHLLVLSRLRWWSHVPALVVADLTALALFSPWLIGVLPGQVGFVAGGYWLTQPGAEELIRALMLPVLTFYEPTPLWLLGLGLFTALLTSLSLILNVWRRQSHAAGFLVLSWTPVILLLGMSCWRPLYLERALLPSALFYAVALGWLLTSSHLTGIPRWGLAVLLALSTTGSLVNHYRYVGFPRPPFDEAAAYLQSHIEPGDTVVHSNKLTYLPMRVYAPDLRAEFLADTPGSPQDTLARPTQMALGISATPTITQAVGSAHSVWLVILDRELQEVQDNSPHLSWLRNRYEEVKRTHFSGVAIIALQRRR